MGLVITWALCHIHATLFSPSIFVSRYSNLPSQGQQQGGSQTCCVNFVRRYPCCICLSIPSILNHVPWSTCYISSTGVELCVLCDSDPPLPVLQENVEVYWSSVEHQLRNCCLAYPRCLSLSMKFDQSILAFSLVNLDKRKSLTCLSPSSSNQSRTTLLTAGEAKRMHEEHFCSRYSFNVTASQS